MHLLIDWMEWELGEMWLRGEKFKKWLSLQKSSFFTHSSASLLWAFLVAFHSFNSSLPSHFSPWVGHLSCRVLSTPLGVCMNWSIILSTHTFIHIYQVPLMFLTLCKAVRDPPWIRQFCLIERLAIGLQNLMSQVGSKLQRLLAVVCILDLVW